MSIPFNPQHGLVIVRAAVEGPSGSAVLRLALDTGATGTVINVGMLVALGYDPALVPERIQVTTGSGVEFVPRVSLHTFGKHLKALAMLAALDDLQDTLALVFDPLHELAGVPTVRPDEGEAGEQAFDLCQDQLGAIAILYFGAMDHDQQQQAERVDEHMAFAPVDLFSRIIAALPTLFGRLDRLGVNDRGGRRGFPSLGLAHLLAQRGIDLGEQRGLAPQAKGDIDGLPRWKIVGEQPPRTASAQHIEDGI